MLKNLVSAYLDNKKNHRLVIICYGNILRSQVLEKYLRHYSKQRKLKLNIYSAGVSKWSEFKSARKLLKEVKAELKKRNIACFLRRKSWKYNTEKKISNADIVLASDNGIKSIILERMDSRIEREKVYTFYNVISEGEKDFEDTYDYEKKRQDPKKFAEAFDELERIAKKIIKQLEDTYPSKQL